MLNNKEHFNQLLMTNPTVKQHLSELMIGINLDEIDKIIDREIEEKFKGQETYTGEVQTLNSNIKFERNFREYNAAWVYDELAKRKYSRITITQEDCVFILAGDEATIKVRKKTKNQTTNLDFLLDTKTGNIEVTISGKTKNQMLDEKNLAILQAQNAEKERLINEAKERKEAEIRAKTTAKILIEDLTLKAKMLDYIIDINCYNRNNHRLFKQIEAYLIPKDFTFNVFENPDYLKSLIDSVSVERNAVETLIKQILSLIAEVYDNFSKEKATSILNSRIFDLIPRENFINKNRNYKLGEVKENDPELYLTVLDHIIASMNCGLVAKIGLDDLVTSIEICYDAIKRIYSTCTKDKVIDFLKEIRDYGPEYFGLKKNVIIFHLKDLLLQCHNSKISDEEQAEIFEFVEAVETCLTPELVSKSISKAQKAKGSGWKYYETLLNENIEIYEKLNNGYTLAKRK